MAAPRDYCCRTKPLAKPQQTDRNTAHLSQLGNRDYSFPWPKKGDIRVYPMPCYTEKYSHMLLHKEERSWNPASLPLKGPCPVLALQVGTSVKSAEILSEDNGLKGALKCNFPELQGTEGRDWVTSRALPAPGRLRRCGLVPGRMAPSPPCRQGTAKGTGLLFYLHSSGADLVGFGCSSALVSGFLSVLVKGHCLLQTKAAWAWHSWQEPEEKKPRQQLKSNKLPPSTSGEARYGQAELVLLFEAFLWVAEANFLCVFAANMFKFSLFWRQVVNASEVHTWHMFLFTCCPPFISCSRCSVYHFKCILIY